MNGTHYVEPTGVKKYKAFIEQDSTNDPVLRTTFINTTGGNVIFSRRGQGWYYIVFSANIVKTRNVKTMSGTSKKHLQVLI